MDQRSKSGTSTKQNDREDDQDNSDDQVTKATHGQQHATTM